MPAYARAPYHGLGEILTGTSVKGYLHGTHRLVMPEQTLARARPYLAALGITRLANVTGLDRIGIPVFMAVRPNSRSLAVAQGKGLTPETARVSAMMEAIETYHAEHINCLLRHASYTEMASTAAVVDVDLLPRPRTNRYHPQRPLLWIQGIDLMSWDSLWVPYQMVHSAYTTAMEFDLGSFYSSSTGLASGNHLLEALSHAICEVIERDATLSASLQSQDDIDARQIDLDTIDHPDCRSLLEKFAQAEVLVGVWESTSDVGVPSFDCVIVDDRNQIGGHPFLAGGSGCHPSRDIALVRALTEAAQSRLTKIAGSRDDLFRSRLAESHDPGAIARRKRAIGQNGSRSFLAAPTRAAGTLEGDVTWLLDRLRAVGIEQVIVVDLTQAEFGLPVVRVLIPGLETALTSKDCLPGPRVRRQMEARA